MSASSHIQYLTRGQVDIRKWDECINESPNGLLYACSFYLDQMAVNWDALVLGDYEAVMPLPWNRKFGIRYVYQPFLTAQLGIFGKVVTEAMVGDFIRAIPLSFRLVELSLNSGNITSVPTGFSIHRNNYVLELNKPYDQLYKNYRENIQRNTRKALQLGCTVTKDFDAEKVIALALQQMNSYGKESADNVERFRKLYRYLHERKMAITYGITLHDELLASCVFFLHQNRAYYILVGNHPNGKTIGASHALIDAFIKDHAGTAMILDFEGSDIRNLAFFYSSFGARQEVYPAIRINRLPFFLRWMKR